eukprot:NODE_11499_length_1283_cov_2.096886.p1 GENE.NODE_11499_length_1283_cov_2.096886~~NODE_11499_length_1283_cov_2.096886.p1  ORF type:complete len:354 (+),score=79.36 NODE_11499_length_1283_cov_2.096886:122-1183(+)
MAAAAADLCRCMCALGTPAAVEPQDETPTRPPATHFVDGPLLFSTALDQPLRGRPVCEGKLCRVCAKDRIVPCKLQLFVNGLTVVDEGADETAASISDEGADETGASISLSPFTIVQKCRIETPEASADHACLARLKVFKVSLFMQGDHEFFYAVNPCSDDQQAEKERSHWVNAIAKVVRIVTQSIFPPFGISCEPIAAILSTQRRLMAGYLARQESRCAISVLYAELHPHSSDQAKIVLYDSELCQSIVDVLPFGRLSIYTEHAGISCSCFAVEDQQFTARTELEAKLWTRALFNVRTKLNCMAPDPTEEDLKNYRAAISECIASRKDELNEHTRVDALLQRTRGYVSAPTV